VLKHFVSTSPKRKWHFDQTYRNEAGRESKDSWRYQQTAGTRRFDGQASFELDQQARESRLPSLPPVLRGSRANSNHKRKNGTRVLLSGANILEVTRVHDDEHAIHRSAGAVPAQAHAAASGSRAAGLLAGRP